MRPVVVQTEELGYNQVSLCLEIAMKKEVLSKLTVENVSGPRGIDKGEKWIQSAKQRKRKGKAVFSVEGHLGLDWKGEGSECVSVQSLLAFLVSFLVKLGSMHLCLGWAFEGGIVASYFETSGSFFVGLLEGCPESVTSLPLSSKWYS